MASLDRFNSVEKLMAHIDWVKQYQATGTAYPITLEIDPTNKCPLDCPYCVWHEMRHGEAANSFIKPEVLLRLVHEAHDIGVKAIVWTGGGEPLSNPGTLPAIELAHSLGIKCGMFSTAIPLTPLVADVLVKCLSWIRIHVDGATEESYGRLHKVNGKVLNRVIQNVKHLTNLNRDLGSPVSISVGTVAVVQNAQEIPALARLAKAMGVEVFQYKHDLTLMREPTHLRWWDDKAVPMMQQIAAELQDEAFTVQFTEGVDYEAEDKSPVCHVHHLITAITATGDVAFCKALRDKPEWALGNIYRQSLKEIFDGKQHSSLSKGITPQNCGVIPCPYKAANIKLQAIVDGREVIPLHVSTPTHLEFI